MVSIDVKTEKLNRMVAIKKQQSELKSEYDKLEAFFLREATSDLKDTKLKTVMYSTDKGSLTATIAQSLKVETPTFLRSIFGKCYDDYVTETKTYKITAPATRLLSGIWMDEFTRISKEELLSQIPCSDKSRETLSRKLKGANFNTDKKNLMEIAGLSEEDASHYAYFVAEVAIWEQFERLLKLNKITEETDINEILDQIDGAVVVEETPKITLAIN